MKSEKDSFLKCVITLFARLLNGRIHFTKEFAGRFLMMEDGKSFQIIRDLKVDPKEELEKSVAVFKVCFKFSGLPLAVNKHLSMFPTPFLIAKSGFLEKIWTFNEGGYFQGIYQFASNEDAEAYPDSFIFKLMTKRSAEGTLSYAVISETVLSDYVKKLIQ